MQTTENPIQPVVPKVVLEQQLETYLIDKAPFQIPQNVKEAIVKYVPWINLVLMVLLFPVVLAVLGLGTLLMPASLLSGPGSGFVYVTTMIVTGITLLLRAIALPGLFGRKRNGWVYTYYSDILNAFLNIVSFSIIGLLFSVVFLFVLFQVRHYYK